MAESINISTNIVDKQPLSATVVNRNIVTAALAVTGPQGPQGLTGQSPIAVQNTPPLNPVLNALWVDTT